ncbi:MAG: hypothetical protein RI920_251, partial [Pseudomonadota bacterium]
MNDHTAFSSPFGRRALVRLALVGTLAGSALALSGCGYNDFQRLD